MINSVYLKSLSIDLFIIVILKVTFRSSVLDESGNILHAFFPYNLAHGFEDIFEYAARHTILILNPETQTSLEIIPFPRNKQHWLGMHESWQDEYL